VQLVEQSGLATQIRDYVRDHLHDPQLSPRQIAAANGLSVRSLYALYESMGTSLEQSIIRQRLEGARTDLAVSPQRYVSIAATARAWGFTNSSFFSQRFRQAFGMTPRQWRAENRPLAVAHRARALRDTLDRPNPSSPSHAADRVGDSPVRRLLLDTRSAPTSSGRQAGPIRG